MKPFSYWLELYKKAAETPLVTLTDEDIEETRNPDPDEVGEILKRGAGLTYKAPKK